MSNFVLRWINVYSIGLFKYLKFFPFSWLVIWVMMIYPSIIHKMFIRRVIRVENRLTHLSNWWGMSWWFCYPFCKSVYLTWHVHQFFSLNRHKLDPLPLIGMLYCILTSVTSPLFISTIPLRWNVSLPPIISFSFVVRSGDTSELAFNYVGMHNICLLVILGTLKNTLVDLECIVF